MFRSPDAVMAPGLFGYRRPPSTVLRSMPRVSRQKRHVSAMPAASGTPTATLTAAIEGLNALRPGAVVTVIANSEYVAKGMNEWLPGWKAKGWRTAAKKPVMNADLWGKLDAAAGKHESVRWVVGERTG